MATASARPFRSRVKNPRGTALLDVLIGGAILALILVIAFSAFSTAAERSGAAVSTPSSMWPQISGALMVFALLAGLLGVAAAGARALVRRVEQPSV